MRADKEWIMVKHLSARRFIVGVVQTYQRVPQKRSELATSCFKLCTRSMLLDDFRQICPYLEFRVMGSIVWRCPTDLLAIGKDWARQVEFVELRCKWKQSVTAPFPISKFFQTIIKGK